MRNQTYVTQRQPWGTYTPSGHRVLCSDGVIRACQMAPTADSFFSIPASIILNHKRISGYVTTRQHNNEVVYCFRHLSNHNYKLPDWPANWTDECKNIIAKAFAQ